VRREQTAPSSSPGYDGHCLGLRPEVARRLAAGETHVVRMKVPREGVCRVQDMLRGEIEVEWTQVDMQVLLKADGMPTYHLANVVDDHLMGITHVLRGEEWINSAPKHLLLYEYFGWQAPVICHLPLLRNPDRSKLSKRRNPTSILYYRRMGFCPKRCSTTSVAWAGRCLTSARSSVCRRCTMPSTSGVSRSVGRCSTPTS
jgi:glutamyl-tRNA synthetase